MTAVPDDLLDVTRTDAGARLRPGRTLDINNAPLVAEQVDRLLAERPKEVVVDLAGLELIDSSGVAVLVKLYKGVRGHGGRLTVVGARDQPLAIFKLLRMDKVFGI